MKRLVMFLALLIASGGPLLAQPKLGQPAPDFAAVDIRGKSHRLSDYRGRIVVLEAFNPDSPFCQNQYKSGALPALQTASISKGAVWLLVVSTPAQHPSYRPPERARRDFSSLGIKATAWLDDNSGQIGHLYGLTHTPQVSVIDAKGNLVYQGAMDDQPSTSGDPRTAKNHVRTAVEALMAGRPVPVPETKPYGTPVNYGK
jgi:hypothetical protein